MHSRYRGSAFGNYDPFEVSVKRVPALLTVRCSGHRPVTYTVKLLGGNSPDPTKRYLYSPSTDENYITTYLLTGMCLRRRYRRNMRNIRTVQPKHHGGVQEVKHTVIGVIPPMQNVKAANDYRDALIIQIEY